MERNKQDNAVSPAIATILIVLITVIGVAVITVIAMGLVNTQPDYVVGLTVKAAPSGPDAVVTLYSSRNLPDLVRVEVIDAGSASGVFVEVWNGTAGAAPIGVPLVAKDVAQPAEATASYATNLWVKGTFADGTEQVLLMQAVTFVNVGTAGGGDEGEGEEKPIYTLYDELVVKWEEYYAEHYNGPWSGVSLKKGLLLKFEDGSYIYTHVDNHWISLTESAKNSKTAGEFRDAINYHGNNLIDFELSDDIIDKAPTVQEISGPTTGSMNLGDLVKMGNKLYVKIQKDGSQGYDKPSYWLEIGKVNPT